MEKKFIGIDVSEHQSRVSRIDWKAVKPHIDYAIIRIGRCVSGYEDVDAKYNIEQCNKLGIPYGLYYFNYCLDVDMAVTEAENCLRMMKEMGAKPVYPVYFDWEYASRDWANKCGVNISNQLLRDMATAFCERIEKEKYPAGIYMNADYEMNHYGTKISDRFTLWYAYYNNAPDHYAPMWQKSSTGKVDGIVGNVDMNECYVDWVAIAEGDKPKPQPQPKPVEPAPKPDTPVIPEAPDDDPEKVQKHWRKFEDIPYVYQKELKGLMDVGALKGFKDQRGLYLTEDMIRVMITMKRYIDHKEGK